MKGKFKSEKGKQKKTIANEAERKHNMLRETE